MYLKARTLLLCCVSGFLSWYWNLFTQRTITWILHNIHPVLPDTIWSFQNIWGTQEEKDWDEAIVQYRFQSPRQTSYFIWWWNENNFHRVKIKTCLMMMLLLVMIILRMMKISVLITSVMQSDPSPDRENIKIVSEFLLFADLRGNLESLHDSPARGGNWMLNV